MITLHTSGSTDEPKRVTHSWEYINQCAKRSIAEIKLTSKDRVLDVFPLNTIAHWTITGYPSVLSSAEYHCSNFTPYTYLEEFKRIQPSYISLLPRHLELLQATKGFKNLDMSCVRYMVTGSTKIEQEFIDAFKDRGVQLVANWYGMTEFPPPVMIGYDTPHFDINTINQEDHHVMFMPAEGYSSNLHQCYINGVATGDLFEMDPVRFVKRIDTANGRTWKNNF
jgi:long-subunit acyl-CoA synthetase (AMP-forming)